jgi:hypothetical protein
MHMDEIEKEIYDIQLGLSWLNCVSDEQDTGFKAQKKLSIEDLTKKLSISTKSDSFKTVLEFTNTANKLRVDTNVSLNLVKHFLTTQEINAPEFRSIEQTGYILTSIGIGIPLLNVFILSLDLFTKYIQDQKQKTQNYEWHLYLKQRQLIKNGILAILNTTNFLVNYFQLFPIRFYFSFANIMVDFVFYCIEYYKNKKFLDKKLKIELEEFEAQYPEEYRHKSLQELQRYFIKEIGKTNTPETFKFLTLHILINLQKQKINRDKILFESITIAFMLSTMIILELCLQNIFLLGLISSYYYNVLMPYFMEFYLEIKNSDQIKVQWSENTSLYLQQGEIYPADANRPPFQIHPELVLCLIAKLLLPLILISQLQLISPVILLICLSGSHLAIHQFEQWAKSNKQPTTKTPSIYEEISSAPAIST